MVIKILKDEQEIVFNNIKANIVGWSDLMIDTPDFYLVKCNFGVLSLSDIDGTHVIVASASESNDINSFILKFNDNDIEESSKKLIKLKNGLYLSVEDGYFEFNKFNSEVTVHFINTELKIQIYEAMSMQSFTASTYTEFNVPSISAIPSISLGAFDYRPLSDPQCCLLQRPVRFGIPVVSTVPVPTALATDDNFNIPQSIEIQFRIILNDYIPPSLDTEILFQIFLPGGEDMLQPPVNIPVTRVTAPSQVNLGSDIVLTNTDTSLITHTIYVCNYIFNQENSNQFIDGYMYFNVFIPMVINTSISGYCQTNTT